MSNITVLDENELSEVIGGSWSWLQVAYMGVPVLLVGSGIVAISIVGNRLYEEYKSRKQFEADLVRKLDDLSKQVDKAGSKK